MAPGWTEPAPLFAAHVVRGASEPQAHGIALDENRSDAVGSRPISDIGEEQRRLGAVSGEHLASVDPVAVAVGGRLRLQVGDGGARLRFRHGDRDQRLAGQQLGQKARLLFLGRILRKGADRPEIAGLDNVGAARADQCDLFDGDDRVHQGSPLAAFAFGNGDAEKALLGQQAGDIPRIPGIVRAPGGSVLQMAFGYTPHRVQELSLLIVQPKVHVSVPLWFPGVSVEGMENLDGGLFMGVRFGARPVDGHGLRASGPPS